MLSFRHDAILPGNGCNTVSFINLIKSVKLCLKGNLRILATRLVGACLTNLNICLLFFIADELQFISVHEQESSSGLHIRATINIIFYEHMVPLVVSMITI